MEFVALVSAEGVAAADEGAEGGGKEGSYREGREAGPGRGG